MRLGAVLPGRPAERHPIGVTEVAADLGGRTADDGSFVLRGVPLQGDIMVEVVAPETRFSVGLLAVEQIGDDPTRSGGQRGRFGQRTGGGRNRQREGEGILFAWSRDELQQ